MNSMPHAPTPARGGRLQRDGIDSHGDRLETLVPYILARDQEKYVGRKNGKFRLGYQRPKPRFIAALKALRHPKSQGDPALKRRAIVGGPSGTGARKGLNRLGWLEKCESPRRAGGTN